VVRRGGSRLDDEHILTADILLHLHKRFAIRERFDGALADFHADGIANGLRQAGIRRAAKNFHDCYFWLKQKIHRRRWRKSDRESNSREALRNE
jgi:hypothetical protein